MAELYHDVSDNGLTLDVSLMNSLYETAKWGRVLAIIGFSFVGLTLLLAFFMQRYLHTLYADAGFNTGLSVFATGFYAVFAFIYFFPSLYLLSFSRNMMEGLQAKDQQLVNAAFRNLRILFKFMGILFVVTLFFYGLAIAFMSVGSLANNAA